MSDTSDDKPSWPDAVGEAAGSVINATLDAIGRQALKDIYYAAIGDRITAWRAGNLANVFRRYQEATRDLPPEGRRFVAEKVGIRFIEEASLEDNPELQKIWANLLAAAVSNRRPDVTTRYVSVAKELMPADVLFIKAAHDFLKTFKRPLQRPIELCHVTPWNNEDQIINIITHLVSLGIVRRVEYELKSGIKLRHEASGGQTARLISLARWDQVKFTKFGWEFVCAAIQGQG